MHISAKWLMLTAITTILVALFFALLLFSLSTSEANDCWWVKWLITYQTLLAGWLAVLASLATTIFLFAQVRLQIEKDEKEQTRRQQAARSVDPATLSLLRDYGKECWIKSLRMYSQSSPDTALWKGEQTTVDELSPNEKLAKLDRETLNVLREWVQVESGVARLKIIAILENYQLFQARMPKVRNNTEFRSQLNLSLANQAVFILIIDECFQFARQFEEVPTDIGSVKDRISFLFGSELREVGKDIMLTAEAETRLSPMITSEYAYYAKNWS